MSYVVISCEHWQLVFLSSNLIALCQTLEQQNRLFAIVHCPISDNLLWMKINGSKISFDITVRSHVCHTVSDHMQLSYLFNSLLRLTSKKTLKICITGLLWKELTLTVRVCTQRSSNAERLFISWSHHDLKNHLDIKPINAICIYIYGYMWPIIGHLCTCRCPVP